MKGRTTGLQAEPTVPSKVKLQLRGGVQMQERLTCGQRGIMGKWIVL